MGKGKSGCTPLSSSIVLGSPSPLRHKVQFRRPPALALPIPVPVVDRNYGVNKICVPLVFLCSAMRELSSNFNKLRMILQLLLKY